MTTTSGRRIELKPFTTYTVGRDAEGEVVLEDSACSRRHARVVCEFPGGPVYLEDLNSRNGCTVDGRLVEGVVELEEGARIRVGGSFLVFRRKLPEFDVKEREETRVLGAEPSEEVLLSGRLEAVSVVELLQILHQSRRTGRLRVETSEGEAQIELRAGEVRWASFRSAEGLPALFALALKGRAGRFALREGGGEEVNVRQSTPQVLMELCRVLDEYETER